MKTALESNRSWFIRTKLADMPHELSAQLVFSDDLAALEKSAAELRSREAAWKQEQAEAHHNEVAEFVKRFGESECRERQRKQRR